MSMEDEIKLWRHLANQAKAGQLYLDPAVAEGCLDACTNQIGLYEALRSDLRYATNVSGFGDFECADELAKMLGAKAIGDEGDVDSALKEHIEVLTVMRDTIQISVDRIVAQDETNSRGTNNLLN